MKYTVIKKLGKVFFNCKTHYVYEIQAKGWFSKKIIQVVVYINLGVNIMNLENGADLDDYSSGKIKEAIAAFELKHLLNESNFGE